jgi:hypothetical protein
MPTVEWVVWFPETCGSHSVVTQTLGRVQQSVTIGHRIEMMTVSPPDLQALNIAIG